MNSPETEIELLKLDSVQTAPGIYVITQRGILHALLPRAD